MTATLSPSYVAVLRYLAATGQTPPDGDEHDTLAVHPSRDLRIVVNCSDVVFQYVAGSQILPHSVYAEWKDRPILGGVVRGTKQEREEWFLWHIGELTRQVQNGNDGRA